MGLDKIELLKELFYGFGRDPHVNKGIFDHYLNKTSDTEPWVLKKAVQELLTGCQSLPRITELLNSIKRFSPNQEYIATECPLCGKDGLIYSIFAIPPSGKKQEVYSLEQKMVKGANYKSMIIGRCKCPNGNQYEQAGHSTLSRAVEPPEYLIELSKQYGFDTAFYSDIQAKKWNKKSRNIQPVDTPLKKDLSKYDKS